MRKVWPVYVLIITLLAIYNISRETKLFDLCDITKLRFLNAAKRE